MKSLYELIITIKENQLLSEQMLDVPDINQLDEEEQQTVLMTACLSGNLETVKKLLNHPAIHVDNGEPNNETALMMTVDCEDIAVDLKSSIILSLINHGTISQKSLDCALIYFAGQGLVEQLQLCIHKKANINAQYLNNTALTEAINNHHTAVANYLLS